ncbi:retrovirus-related pol polyprotein from transposon TNT 1-94 [Tanacetum coccineum]
MAAEVPQTLEYRGGQLNVAPVLENGPYVPMTAGQRKLEGQWTDDERKAANLDQRLKSLILSVLSDDQMNYVINCLKAKSTWDDLILYYKDPSDKKSLVTATPLSTAFFSTSIVQDFQDSPDDEEDTKSSQEYLNDLEEEYQERALLAKSKRFFKKGSQRFTSAKATDDTICHKCGRKGHFARDCFSKTLVSSYSSPFQKPKTTIFSPSQKPELRPNKDFEAKYNKVKGKLALFSSKTSSKSSMVKNKGLVAEAYEWDEEDVLLDDNEMNEVKVLMALADDENVTVGKESARNEEWVKISMRKVHTLLDMEDNDERKSFLDYLCIDLNYVEEKRNNLMLKHRNLHANTEILKENKNLRIELKKLTTITETYLNTSNKVNQCVERPWLSKAEGFTLPNHDTGRILPAESQVKITDPLVAITDSSVTE